MAPLLDRAGRRDSWETAGRVSRPSFLSSPGTPSVACDADQVEELARWILRPTRSRPVVVLTVPLRERAPYFDPDDVIAAVGAAADVVVVAQSRDHVLTRRLQSGLPSGLEVYNGAARIYWPVSDVGDRPAQHPLVRADSPAAGPRERHARLVGRWRQGPIAPPTSQPTPEVGEVGLLVSIVRAHLQLFPDLEDRRRYPLAAHVALEALVDQVDALESARAPVAAAAAAVLCGYAWRHSGPGPERLVNDGELVVRGEDQAVAWRVPLEASDRYLAYWQPTVGPVELARITGPDGCELPGAQAAAAAPGPPTPTSAPSSTGVAPASRHRFDVGDEELLAAFDAAGAPMRAAEIREALGIPDEVSPQVLRRVLTAAIDRGLLVREGEKRTARYRLVDAR